MHHAQTFVVTLLLLLLHTGERNNSAALQIRCGWLEYVRNVTDGDFYDIGSWGAVRLRRHNALAALNPALQLLMPSPSNPATEMTVMCRQDPLPINDLYDGTVIW